MALTTAQEPLRPLWRRNPLSDHFLQVRINGDVAVLKGINKAVIEAEDRLPGAILDWNFIRGYTSGFEEFVEHIRTVDWLEIEEQSGIALERITEIGSKSEVAIIAGIAEATVGGDVKWTSFLDYDQIRDRASRVVAGFERFNERMRTPGGFYAPVAAKQRQFHTAVGKANFTVNPIRSFRLAPNT